MKNQSIALITLSLSILLVGCGAGIGGSGGSNGSSSGGSSTNASTNPSTHANSEPTQQISAASVSKPGGGYYDLSECMQDKTNHLMWEGKVTGWCDHTTNPRSGHCIFTNFDSEVSGIQETYCPAATCPAATASDIAAASNSIGYMRYVNAQKLCGFNDWRMPTDQELLILMDLKTPSTEPRLTSAWYPRLGLANLWSSWPAANDSNRALAVGLDLQNNAVVNRGERWRSATVILVRNSK